MPPVILEAKPKSPEIEYLTRDGKPMAETALHRKIMMYCIDALEGHYRDNPTVHIAGNNFLYWVEGVPQKSVSPDVYVVYGVRHYPRDTYKVWEEGGITPNVIFEFTSKSTKDEDNTKKFPLYEQVLKVDEYFRYDPTGDYLNPRLQGFRLEQGRYQPIPLENGDRIYSQNLELFLVMLGEDFRFYEPETDEFLKTHMEMQFAYEEAQAAYEDEQQLRLEAVERARNAEEELSRLRAELERLKQGETAE